MQTALTVWDGDRDALTAVLDEMAVATYVTDGSGLVTYFNQACIALTGRTPVVNHDRWCVTWKLYTVDGSFLPHDQCPMAVAIREQRPVRGLEALAERPDGSRIRFIPYPTPLFDGSGAFAGAINLLVDVTERRHAQKLWDQAARCRRLAKGTLDAQTMDILMRMAIDYDEQAGRLERPN